jgi:hypothetical protein
MTPKAPPDIDKWMMDPPAANKSTSILTVRNIESSTDHTERQIHGSFRTTTSKAEQDLTAKSLWLAVFVTAFFPLFVLLYIAFYSVDSLWGLISRLDRYTKAIFGIKVFELIGKRFEAWIGRRGIAYIIIYTTILQLLVVSIASGWLWSSRDLLESWSAASDFLEKCKMQQV